MHQSICDETTEVMEYQASDEGFSTSSEKVRLRDDLIDYDEFKIHWGLGVEKQLY